MHTLFARKFINLCQLKNGFCFQHIYYHAEVSTEIKAKNIMPRTMKDVEKLLNGKVESPENSKLIKVAFIGIPNSGKSTLVNSIIGWRACTVSKKVHTTLKNTMAIQTVDKTQMILMDAPGVITPKEFHRHKVKHKSHLLDPELCFKEADLIAVIHDSSKFYTRERLNPSILKLLALYPHVPSILILNKIDSLKKFKKSLLHITHCVTQGKLRNEPACQIEEIVPRLSEEELRQKLIGSYSLVKYSDKSKEDAFYFDTKQPGYLESKIQSEINAEEIPKEDDAVIKLDDVINGTIKLTEQQAIQLGQREIGWPMFQEVFMVSAKTGNGVEDVRNYILNCAYSSPWSYNPQMITNQDPIEFVKMTIREKLLNALPGELPYLLTYHIEHWNFTSSEVLEISMTVKCRKYTQIRFILSHKINKIINECAEELKNIFCCEVQLSVSLKSIEAQVLRKWQKQLLAQKKGNQRALSKKYSSDLL